MQSGDDACDSGKFVIPTINLRIQRRPVESHCHRMPCGPYPRRERLRQSDEPAFARRNRRRTREPNRVAVSKVELKDN